MTRKIGIGITTLNRRDIFMRALREMDRCTTKDVPIVVVDDGSDIPVPKVNRITVRIRNNHPRGIAHGKNQCIAALMAMPEVTDLFLFDDDVWPTEFGWEKTYLESDEQHLSHQPRFNGACARCQFGKPLVYNTIQGRPLCQDCCSTQLIYDGPKKFAVAWPSGTMLYMTRHAVDTVGGMRKQFTTMEHCEYSMRMHHAGLIEYAFQDIHNPKLYALDAYQPLRKRSIIPPDVRRRAAPTDKALCEKFAGTSDFVPYIEGRPQATVCIPWRATPDRIAAHDYCMKYWADHGFTVINGDSDPSKPFLCGQARNNAARQAKTDIVIIADGDTVPGDIDQIYAAIDLVNLDSRCAVWPFTVYKHVPAASMELRDLRQSPVDQEYRHGSPGGMVVINRETFWSICGFDERFVPGAWGFDDTSFLLAAKTLLKVERVDGTVYSFNHSVDSSGVDGRDLSENNPNKARWRLYEFASRASEAVMRELVKDQHFTTRYSPTRKRN